MLVRINPDGPKSAWFFSEPLTTGLWFTILAFFVLTGLVVWVLEHRFNKAFRGPLSQQLGMILWFPLTTLVFAHRERLVSNLTRCVVMIWIFAVLVLTSTYTASLSSILTVDRLQPAVTSVQDLLDNGDFVGYQQGAFMLNMLKGMKFDESKIKSCESIEDCDKALSKGSQNGGISVYFDVKPYIDEILAKHCDKYIEVNSVNRTDGFGFIFSRGSPLVGDISRTILNITQGHKMIEIDRTWYWIKASFCSDRKKKNTSSSALSVYSFRGLFIITGTVSAITLLIFLGKFVYEHWNTLTTPTAENGTFRKRCTVLLEIFDARDQPIDEVNLRFLRNFVKEIVAEALASNVPAVAAPIPAVPVAVMPDRPVTDRLVQLATIQDMQDDVVEVEDQPLMDQRSQRRLGPLGQQGGGSTGRPHLRFRR